MELLYKEDKKETAPGMEIKSGSFGRMKHNFETHSVTPFYLYNMWKSLIRIYKPVNNIISLRAICRCLFRFQRSVRVEYGRIRCLSLYCL